jgi:hypothetical protein
MRERLLRGGQFKAMTVGCSSGVPVRFLELQTFDEPVMPADSTTFLNDRFGDL